MFNPFRSKNRPANRSRRVRQKLNLVPLESREVPSVVPILDSGRLMLEGTPGDDMIQVQRAPRGKLWPGRQQRLARQHGCARGGLP